MRFVILYVLFLYTFSLSQAKASKRFFDPPVIISLQQTRKLQQFKQNVFPLIPPNTHVYNFSCDDLYFVKWLEALYWDVTEATTKFVEHLKWRKDENIEGIDEEDWSLFQIEYPAYVDENSTDRMGRPVAEIWLTDWDIRKAVVAGRIKRLARWITRTFEVQERHLYKARRNGRNITQGVLLWELGNYNPLIHGCKECVKVLVNMGHNWENHYPYLYESSIAVNSTPAFQVILRALRPFLKNSTVQSMQVYSIKETWLPVLDSKIGKDQRSIKFGGTLTRNMILLRGFGLKAE